MALQEQGKMRVYQDEEILVREGKVSNEMYKILKGSVIVYLHYGEDDEHVIGIYSAGRCLGEWSLFTGQPSIYTVVAYGEVLVLCVTKDYMETFIRENPRNAIDIISNMSTSMGMMRKNIELLLEEMTDKKKFEVKDDMAGRVSVEEMRRRVLQYSMNGILDWSQATLSKNV